MKTEFKGRRIARRLVFLAAMGAAALLPFTLRAQSPTAAATKTAPAASWADDILAAEHYVEPPKELVDAVLAPRYLNVSLSNLSPDKQWYLDEVGDGPVVMKTFSKPYHELGGVFIDFKANRARSLTVRNNIGIEIISAADRRGPPGAVAGRGAGLERDVVARRQEHRLLRPRRRCDADLDRRRDDRPGPPGYEDARAGDARYELRFHGRRQTNRHRARARQPQGDASGAGRARRPDGEGDRQREEPACGPMRASCRPSTSSTCSSGTRRARWRSSTSRPAPSPSGRTRDGALDRRIARRQVPARHPHGSALLVHRAREQLRVGRRSVGHDRQGADDHQRPAPQCRRGVAQRRDANARRRAWRRQTRPASAS